MYRVWDKRRKKQTSLSFSFKKQKRRILQKTLGFFFATRHNKKKPVEKHSFL